MAQPFMKPQPIVEMNRNTRHSPLQMNSAVARITGMKRAVLIDRDELNEQAPVQTPPQGHPHLHPQAQLPPPPPSVIQPQAQQLAMRNGLTQWDYTEADMQEATNRRDQSNRGPESSAYERGHDGARDSKAPEQKMPRKDAKASPYGTKRQDDEEDEVGKTQPEDREMRDNEVVEGSITHVAGLPMDTFREMAGMAPIYDLQESKSYWGQMQTGQVPTRQATSYTKMPAGYGQQEGGFAQSLHPQEYGHDGADSEMTFDQAIGMLKKEGLEQDYMWSRFLGENQLSIPVLEMLCDEAMETGNETMAEELMQLEAAFDHFYESSLVEAFGPELAEGLLSKIMGKKKSTEPRAAVGTDVTPAGSGVAVGKGAAGPGPSTKPFKLKPIGGAMPKKASGGPQVPAKLLPKKTSASGGIKLPPKHPRASGAMESRMSLDADDDGSGNPKMPWDNGSDSFDKLSAKYGGGSKNAGAPA